MWNQSDPFITSDEIKSPFFGRDVGEAIMSQVDTDKCHQFDLIYHKINIPTQALIGSGLPR